jgi:hypothetical protein
MRRAETAHMLDGRLLTFARCKEFCSQVMLTQLRLARFWLLFTLYSKVPSVQKLPVSCACDRNGSISLQWYHLSAPA